MTGRHGVQRVLRGAPNSPVDFATNVVHYCQRGAEDAQRRRGHGGSRRVRDSKDKSTAER
eukprot:7243278-Alexandrium_andersonii.AAC.1